MTFLFVLAVTCVCVLVLRNPIRKAPIVLYAACVVLVGLFIAGINGALPGGMVKPLILLVQRCMLALSLFTIVMFIGVLPRRSKLDAWLRPIRAELSIAACILCLGHVYAYLVPYMSRALSGYLRLPMVMSIVVAVILFALLVVLGVTSINAVKQRMSGKVWKNIQRFAYPFFGLVWVHLMFILVPAAARGGQRALTSVIVYSVIFVAYIALRLWRARESKKLDANVQEQEKLANVTAK